MSAHQLPASYPANGFQEGTAMARNARGSFEKRRCETRRATMVRVCAGHPAPFPNTDGSS